jgi:recombination protein RecA
MEDAARAFLKKLGKQYGDSVFSIPKVDSIPAVSLGLNILTGIGGAPRGRILEFYGPESGGKTTIALNYIAQANKMGLRCMYVDLEAALDLNWARKLGVDFSKTDYVRPPNGEIGFDIMVEAAKTGLYGLIVMDSVAALVSEAEMNADSISDTKDRVGGYVAKLMNVGLRKLQATITPTNTAVIFINQVRDAIGVMYGDPETTPGGKALKFYASVRIRVSKLTKKDTIKMSGDIQIGHRVRCTIKKNKVGAPDSRPAEFDLYYESGIDQLDEIIDWGHNLQVFNKRGETITFNEQRISVDDFIKKLTSDQDFKNMVITEIMSKSHLPILTQAEEVISEEENG